MPTSSMGFSKKKGMVDSDGKVFGGYLDHWSRKSEVSHPEPRRRNRGIGLLADFDSQGCSLIALVDSLRHEFSINYPLVSISTALPQSTPSPNGARTNPPPRPPLPPSINSNAASNQAGPSSQSSQYNSAGREAYDAARNGPPRPPPIPGNYANGDRQQSPAPQVCSCETGTMRGRRLTI